MRKRHRLEAAFIVTVGLGAAAVADAGIAQRPTPNPPARTPPTGRRARPLPPLHAGHVIQRDGAGVCRIRDTRPCGGEEDCSGEDAYVVRCPSGLARNWSMRVLGDGACELTLYRFDGCPQGARCNPPPPRRVACPGSPPLPPQRDIIVD